MADDDLGNQTQTPPPAANAGTIDYGALAQQLMQQPQPVQPDTTPVKRGWLSLLGEALGGGRETGAMSPAQSESAGLRALTQFGTGLMAASRYQPGQTVFSNLAQGFQGAGQSERGSEQQAAAYLGAQQGYQQQQQQMQLERLKAAMPLLTLDQQQRQAAAARALAGGATPGTSTGAGGPAIAPPSTYEGAIGGMEGTGKNPRSSSSGVGGFLDSTWQDFAAANPDLFKGMTPQQVLDAKSDPGLGAKAITWLAQRNAGELGNSGIAPSGQSLGIAHYVGPGAAASVMAAPDNAPVSNFVSPAAVKANPELATMTAGLLKQRYANVPNPGFLSAKGTQFAGPGVPSVVAPGAAAAPPVPVGNLGLVKNPDGSVGTPGGGFSGAPAAPPAPAVAATTPPAAPGATTTPTAATPPAAVTPPATPSPYPDIKAGDVTVRHPGSFADYYNNQYLPPPQSEIYNPDLTPTQKAAFATKAQQLQLAQAQISQTMLPADVPKALIDIKAKQADLAAEQQNAIQAKAQAAAEKLAEYQKTQLTGIQARYNDAAKAYSDAAQGQLTSQNKIAELKAQSGFSTEAEGAKQAFETDTQQIKKMGDAAVGAQDVSNQLQQLRTVIPGAVGPGVISSIIQKNPAVVPFLTMAGAITPQQANDTQAMMGMTNYLSTQLRPTGTGTLRIPEMDAFKSVLPTLMQTPAGRIQATAFLQNLNDRIVQQHEFAQQYFRRPDPATGKPAYNLDNLQDAMAKPRQIDANGINRGGLGPVVPSAPDWRQGPDAMTSWVTKNVDVGHPYMGWDYPRDPNSGRPQPINPKTGQKNAPELQLKVREQ